jgi:hypothetical protein
MRVKAHIDLVRCGPKESQKVLVTSHELVGNEVYWLDGRSNPHTSDHCEGCAQKRPHIWYGWLACYDEQRMQHLILEVTARCVDAIQTHMANFGTLRGAYIKLKRRNGKPNGAMSAELLPSGLPAPSIPLAVDVQEHMMALWASPSDRDKSQMRKVRPADVKQDEGIEPPTRSNEEKRDEPTTKAPTKPPRKTAEKLTKEEKAAIANELKVIDKVGAAAINEMNLEDMVKAGITERSAKAIIERRKIKQLETGR